MRVFLLLCCGVMGLCTGARAQPAALARIDSLLAAHAYEEARAALRAALDAQPDALPLLERDLWARAHDRPAFLPPLQEQRLRDRARRLLARDASNAVAHWVLAQRAVADVDDRLDEVELGAIAELDYVDSLVDLLVARARAEPDPATGGIAFADVEASGVALPIVSKRASAGSAFERAEQHLAQALADSAGWRPALRALVEVMARTERFRGLHERLQQVPPAARDAEYWRWRGMAAFFAGAIEDADAAFDGAMAAMSPREREPWEAVGHLDVRGQAAAGGALGGPDAYWRRRDPRRMTDPNERQLEHLARMVYADVRWGRDGEPGWRTDPGRVVVHFGLPEAAVTYDTRGDRYAVLHYADYDFRLMDLGKTGRWVFYTPPAQAYQGARAPGRTWENDTELLAQSVFVDEPARTAFEPPRRLRFTPRVWRFPQRGAPDERWVGFALPVGEADTLRLALFALDRLDDLAARLDTVLRVGASPWDDTLAVLLSPLPPAASEALLVEFERGEGVGYERIGTPEAEPCGAAATCVSDLVLLRAPTDDVSPRLGPGAIRRGARVLYPAPSGRFRAGAPTTLYLEVDVPRAAAPLRAEVVVELEREREPRRGLGRLFGRRSRDVVTLRFEETLGGGLVPLEYGLDWGARPAGRYRLGVEVREAGGRVVAEREATVEIVD